MKWYHYIACFFAGAFLANFIPHFVHGVSGDSFPSPWSDPPGKGLSSAPLNVAWGLANLVIGYVLLKVGKVSQENKVTLLVWLAGFALMSVNLSYAFVDKMH